MEGKEIVEKILEYKGMGVPILASMLGVTAQNLYDILRGKTTKLSPRLRATIVREIPEINSMWLLTGEGNMLTGEGNMLTTQNDQDLPLIPLLNIDSVGGMHSNNAVTDTPQYTERLIPFENAQQGDIAIYQSGESMSPTIPAGSILQIRQIHDWQQYIGYGDIYVVELINGRRLTKEITRDDNDPKNSVLCVSHNAKYPPETLPRAMIKSMWKVIRILIELGW